MTKKLLTMVAIATATYILWMPIFYQVITPWALSLDDIGWTMTIFAWAKVGPLVFFGAVYLLVRRTWK